ncbi:MAG: glycosyltransferase [Gemmatimonadota bacterium]|nr:MAG: glycosyltransferase [Gemmatimonadota bacterium]
MGTRIAVILSTYNQPAHLERVLWGYARQSLAEFRLLIADDGSGPETRAVIGRVQAETGLRIGHVWQEDRGFRKTEILNRALLAAEADYLIFSDGDCIPREDFVAVHARQAEPGRFLSGGALRLSPQLTETITIDDVRSGRAMDARWLLSQSWRPGRRRLRLLRSPLLAGLLDLVALTSPTWNGGNASTWRRHLLEVNGFDTDIGYGSEDRALGARLENLGLRGKSIRYQAPLLHLEHPRPYMEKEIVERNRALRKRLKRDRVIRAARGLAELEDSGGTRTQP